MQLPDPEASRILGDLLQKTILPCATPVARRPDNQNPLPRGMAAMTIDKSLKIRAGMIRNRNVLTRAERLEKLQATERWKEGDPVLGLPKVRVQKVTLKKKKKVKKQDDESK